MTLIIQSKNLFEAIAIRVEAASKTLGDLLVLDATSATVSQYSIPGQPP